MKKIIKSIFIFYVFIITVFGCISAKASTLATEELDYYFTFLKDNNRNFSDKSTIYYIDGRVTYCIEPGVQLGSEYNNTGSLDHLDESKRNKILNYMYYGYLFNNHTDKKYYMATQALIWEELLSNSQEVVYSTQSFKKGDILDISSYKNDIINTINLYTSGAVYSSSTNYKAMLGQSIGIADYNNIYNDYNFYYVSPYFTVEKINNQLFVSHLSKSGNYTISLNEIDKYNNSYIVLHDDNKQDLLVLGNIPHKTFNMSLEIYGGSINITKKDNNDNLLEGAIYDLYDNNDNLINTLTTNSDGLIEFIDVPIGLYYIKESKAPIGYELNDEKVYVEIKKKSPVTNITLYNEPIVGELTINKLDIDNNKPINNTSFDIYDDNMNAVDTIITDNEGKASINLNYGKYYYKEVINNSDYILDDKIYDIDINESIIYERNVYNKHIEVNIPVIEKLSNNIVEDNYDELVITNVPNTSKLSIIPILCLIGAIIIEEKIS